MCDFPLSQIRDTKDGKLTGYVMRDISYNDDCRVNAIERNSA